MHYNYTVVDCGDPSMLNNGGTVTAGLTTYLSIAFYFCASGYSLSAAPGMFRTCMDNGDWSGPNPTCDRESVYITTIIIAMATCYSKF